MTILEAIQEALLASGLTQGELARRLEIDTSNVSRALAGKIYDDPPLSVITKIERALDLRPGTLLIRAGLVELPNGGPPSVEGLISGDPALDDDFRPIVLDHYRSLVDVSKRRRGQRRKHG